MKHKKTLLAILVALTAACTMCTATVFADHVYGDDSESYYEYDETDARFDNIDLDKISGTMPMKVGDTLDMAAEMIFDFQGAGGVKWSSSRPEIATVSASGKVTAVGEGIASIVATYKDNRDNTRTNTMRVKVGTGPASAETPPEYSLIMTPGEFLMAGELVFPGASGTVQWSTSDKTVAAADKTGRLLADSFGKCTITAVYGEKTRTISVQVVSAKGTIDKPFTITLAKGSSSDFRQVLHPYFSQESTYCQVRCTTSDAGVATVEGCIVKAVKAGTCTITVTHTEPAGGASKTQKIVVKVS